MMIYLISALIIALIITAVFKITTENHPAMFAARIVIIAILFAALMLASYTDGRFFRTLDPVFGWEDSKCG